MAVGVEGGLNHDWGGLNRGGGGGGLNHGWGGGGGG